MTAWRAAICCAAPPPNPVDCANGEVLTISL
jgi:hypothetical protein